MALGGGGGLVDEKAAAVTYQLGEPALGQLHVPQLPAQQLRPGPEVVLDVDRSEIL